MTTTGALNAPVEVAPDLPVPPSEEPLPAAVVDSYRRNGFVQLRGMLTPAEVQRYAAAAREVYEHGRALNASDPTFKQVVNVWRDNPVLRELTWHAGLAAAATALAGIPLRLWHDQLLMKRPHNRAATEYHQDAPYWPHAGARHSLSAWVALVDVPLERGCMSFLPGQQERRDIRAVDLTNRTDLFEAAPDLVYSPRVTLPLRAGDVTFHSGFTPHAANPERHRRGPAGAGGRLRRPRRLLRRATARLHRPVGPHRRPAAAGRRVPAAAPLTGVVEPPAGGVPAEVDNVSTPITSCSSGSDGNSYG